MITSAVENSSKTSPTPVENQEQTPKIPVVGLAEPTQALTEKALPPVQDLEKTSEHLNSITKELNVRVEFRVITSTSGPAVVAVDIDKNAIIRQVEHHVRMNQDFDTTKGVILSTNA